MRLFALACFATLATAFRARPRQGAHKRNVSTFTANDYDCDGDGNNDCRDWHYLGARCDFGHKCEYRYRFGDFLLDHSCRCQSRCMGDNLKNCEPPKEPTYEWSVKTDGTHGPCAAHMDHELPISFPLLCTGQARGLKLSARARGWMMSRLHLQINGESKGSRTWPIWPATRTMEMSLDSLAPGTHRIIYSGHLKLEEVTLQGSGGLCSFDVAPNLGKANTQYTYTGLDVTNRLFGEDANYPESQKKQIYFVSETVGRNADGSIDSTVVAEGWWQWLYQYSQQQLPNDPWATPDTRLWEESEIKPWLQVGLARLGRQGQVMPVVEPCNYLSSMTYMEAAVWASCKAYPFSQDEMASVIATFHSLAAGTAFNHASGTSVGGRADTFAMDWLMLQQYQILVQGVLTQAGDKLTQEERNAIMTLGYNVGQMTDLAKNMTQLFSQKYDGPEWNRVMRSFDIPPFEYPIAGLVSFSLWALQGKLPIPGLDSLLEGLVNALIDIFGLQFGDFLKDVYTPAIRKALSFSNLRWSKVMPVLGSFLKFLLTFVEALVFQEQQIPVPKEIRDVWGFIDRLGFSTDLLADMRIQWDYYNGFNCRERSDHTTWHEKASYGLIHSLRLAELFSSGVVPASGAAGATRAASMPASTELVISDGELGEMDPAALVDEMDANGDGHLSQEEIEQLVHTRRWYTEKEESFEKEFAPVFPDLFPLADVSADGKLNVQEVQALMQLLEEFSEHGLPHLLGMRRMDGFQRIWAIADGAAWHAANSFVGYDSDAASDLRRRDSETTEMAFEWKNSPLEPIADNVKWMAQDFAWYAVNHLWNGVSEADSQDHAKYLQHREKVRLALDGAGVPAGELFSQINLMVVNYAWYTAQTRYRGEDPGNAVAAAHWAHANEQLNQLFAEDAWPLFPAPAPASPAPAPTPAPAPLPTWKPCKDTKRNYCTAHPIDWYQPSCSSAHGSGYVKVSWEHCNTVFSARYICERIWTCTQDHGAADCCR